MRVRLTENQAYEILDALKDGHLCDLCQYDGEHNVLKGTACGTQELIWKFERVCDGRAYHQGLRGGSASAINRKYLPGKIRRELMDELIEKSWHVDRGVI